MDSTLTFGRVCLQQLVS
ncbi:hypothetical protein LINGRAHAP2_LOCUS31549 [Linum grandiflorum]